MSARTLVVALSLLATAVTTAQTLRATSPMVSVTESGPGAYTVSARFSVPEQAGAVRAALTDYENIPRFMPAVRMTRVLDRGEGHARIEQEAVSQFMMFSKRVHLVLDIDETTTLITFRDRCGKSFTQYEGAWNITQYDEGTSIEYRLTASPAFDVPSFVVRRLLDRDARGMIAGLRAAIRARALAR